MTEQNLTRQTDDFEPVEEITTLDLSDNFDDIDSDEDEATDSDIKTRLNTLKNHLLANLYSLGIKPKHALSDDLRKTLKESGTKARRLEILIAFTCTAIAMTLLSLLLGYLKRAPMLLRDPQTPMGFLTCITTTLSTGMFFLYALLSIILACIAIYVIHIKTGMLDDRNIRKATADTYGSDEIMSDKEIRDTFRVEPIETNDGPLYGKLDTGEVVARHVEYRPGKKNFNSSVVVFGASGNRKTRGYLINNIYQSIRRGESVIINDPKMELYALTRQQFEKEGYKIHLFATKPDFMDASDRWNPLTGIKGDFVKASMVANRILATKDSGFWTDAAFSLLTGLIQYVTANDVYIQNGKNTLCEIMRMITTETDRVKTLAATIPFGHPALDQLTLFSNAEAKVQTGAIFNLGLVLGLFSGGKVGRLVSHSDFSLTDAAYGEKHAYFMGTDDQDDTFYFLNGLLINFFYIDLIGLIDTLPERKAKRPIAIYLEEANQLGIIKDLDKKVSAARSRNLHTTLIFQDINMIRNLYGQNLTGTILNNCASWVVIGSNDMETNKFMSARAGTMTVLQNSTSDQTRPSLSPFNSAASTSNAMGEGKRETLTIGEMFRSGDNVLLFASKCHPVILRIFDMTEHPMYIKNEANAIYHQQYKTNPNYTPPQPEPTLAPSPNPAPEPDDKPLQLPTEPMQAPSNIHDLASQDLARAINQTACTPEPPEKRPETRSNRPMQQHLDLPEQEDTAPKFDQRTDPHGYSCQKGAYLNKKGIPLPETVKRRPPYFVDDKSDPHWVFVDHIKWTKEQPLRLMNAPKPPCFVAQENAWYYLETLKDPTPVPLENQLPVPEEKDIASLMLESRFFEKLPERGKPKFAKIEPEPDNI